MKDYKEHLLEQLKKPEEAAAYLNAALQDNDPHVFLLALRDIVEAQGDTPRHARGIMGINGKTIQR